MIGAKKTYKACIFDQSDDLLPARPGESILTFDHDGDFKHDSSFFGQRAVRLQIICSTLVTPTNFPFLLDVRIRPTAASPPGWQWSAQPGLLATRTVCSDRVPVPRQQTQNKAA